MITTIRSSRCAPTRASRCSRQRVVRPPLFAAHTSLRAARATNRRVAAGAQRRRVAGDLARRRAGHRPSRHRARHDRRAPVGALQRRRAAGPMLLRRLAAPVPPARAMIRRRFTGTRSPAGAARVAQARAERRRSARSTASSRSGNGRRAAAPARSSAAFSARRRQPVRPWPRARGDDRRRRGGRRDRRQQCRTQLQDDGRRLPRQRPSRQWPHAHVPAQPASATSTSATGSASTPTASTAPETRPPAAVAFGSASAAGSTSPGATTSIRPASATRGARVPEPARDRDRDQRHVLSRRKARRASPSGATRRPTVSSSPSRRTRFATNRRVLGEAGESIERFLGSGLAELGPKLGPIVWQFATTKQFDGADFGSFSSSCRERLGSLALRHAMEVRHPSFKTRRVPGAGAAPRRRDGVRRLRRVPVVRRSQRRFRLCAADEDRVAVRERLSARGHRCMGGPGARLDRGTRARRPGARRDAPQRTRSGRATPTCSSSAAPRSVLLRRRSRRSLRWPRCCRRATKAPRDKAPARPRARGACRDRLRYSAAVAAEQERGDGEDDEDHEQDLGDARRAGSDAAEAEQSRDQRDHEEHDGIVKHVWNSWLAPRRGSMR